MTDTIELYKIIEYSLLNSNIFVEKITLPPDEIRTVDWFLECDGYYSTTLPYTVSVYCHCHGTQLCRDDIDVEYDREMYSGKYR